MGGVHTRAVAYTPERVRRHGAGAGAGAGAEKVGAGAAGGQGARRGRLEEVSTPIDLSGRPWTVSASGINRWIRSICDIWNAANLCKQTVSVCSRSVTCKKMLRSAAGHFLLPLCLSPYRRTRCDNGLKLCVPSNKHRRHTYVCAKFGGSS